MSETREPGGLEGLWDSFTKIPGEIESGIEGLWRRLKGAEERIDPEHKMVRPTDVARGTATVAGRLGKIAGQEVGAIAKGMYEAGPGTLEKFRTGELQPGTPEAVGKVAETGLAFGALGTPVAPAGALRAGFGARAAPSDVKSVVSLGTDAVRKTFAPTARGPLAAEAEATIREGTGTARQRIAQDMAAVESVRRLEAPLIPEFRTYLDQLATLPDAGARRAVPQPRAMRLIETYETGKPLAPDLQPYQPIIDAVRNIAEPARREINADPLTRREVFIDNYYRHSYEGFRSAQAMGSRMGSTSMLKERMIPTLSEAIIDAGLRPKDLSMIDTMMRYSANVQHYLGTNRIFHAGRDSGNIKYFTPGNEPEGWVPLRGRLAEKAAGIEREGEPAALTLRAYAPEPYARVYNASAHVDPGWANLPGFHAARLIANSSIMAKLGFSLYHATAMAEEATTSGLAKALGELTSGELKEAARTAGMSLIPGSDVVRKTLGTGRKFQEHYLGIADHGPDFEKITSLGARAGGRFVGRGMEWRGTEMANYVRAFKRGALRYEISRGLRGIAGQPGESAAFRGVLAAPRAGLFFAREVGRMMESLSAPLFDTVIPRIKSAAFYDEMYAWLRQNPGADDRAQMAFARRLWDSIDDRFGEMVLDNVFWNQRLKQSLQMILTSLGWQLGSYRGMGGAMFDLARGQWTPRLRWAIMLPATWGLYNAVYQYLKTGKSPLETGTPGVDVTLPRTGGKLVSGLPERAILPGYEKDVLGLWHDPFTKITGAVNPALTFGTEMVTGRDWRGQAIAPRYPGGPSWLTSWAQHVIEGFEPISVSQLGQRPPGTAITPGESLLGIRGGPQWLADPRRAELGQHYGQLRAAIDRLSADINQGRRMGMKPSDLQKLVNDRTAAYKELAKVGNQLKALGSAPARGGTAGVLMAPAPRSPSGTQTRPPP